MLDPDGTQSSEIFVMDADGANKRRLTRNPAYDSNPAYSPDGKEIAFSSNRANLGLEEGYIDVWKMGADGSDPARVTDHFFFETDPDWQPLP